MNLAIEFSDILVLLGLGLSSLALYQNHKTRKELRHEAPIEMVKGEVMAIYELATSAAVYDDEEAEEFLKQASIKYSNLFGFCKDKLEYNSLISASTLQTPLTEFFSICVSEDLTKKKRAVCEADGTFEKMEESRYKLILAIDETAKALWKYTPRT